MHHLAQKVAHTFYETHDRDAHMMPSPAAIITSLAQIFPGSPWTVHRVLGDVPNHRWVGACPSVSAAMSAAAVIRRSFER